LKRFAPKNPDRYIDSQTTVFWFRRDLRLDDNVGLYRALKDSRNVLPVFIFDTEILDLLDDKRDARVEFILHSLTLLHEQLRQHESDIFVWHGNPVVFFKQITPKAVFANEDYEPYARTRDAAVGTLLQAKGIPFQTFKDQVIFAKSEVVKDDGKPYTVFTPYSRKWKSLLNSENLQSCDSLLLAHQFKKTEALSVPTLHELGFESTGLEFPPRVIRQTIIENYHEQRNFPALAGTTRLSVHLRFGTVSIRKLATVARAKNETWLNELIWRDFYHMILWHFPHVAERAFKPAYDHIQWRNHPEEFGAWCNGQTGYPLVDAGMRELNATGFMHNRVRMVVASFLTKHLLIDWRWGEHYFAKKLLDFDLAANNGGWQWAAGSGCDAAPYFRVFNPLLQTEKFDPEQAYIKKWVPELGTAAYPPPIVEHAFARKRALEVYQQAVGKSVVA
jgi:deoxyribodipyrimidine photo-lyase